MTRMRLFFPALALSFEAVGLKVPAMPPQISKGDRK